jgi:hypothetical protein
LERGGKPPAEWTDEERFLYARACNDYAWFCLRDNNLQNAFEYFNKSVGQFEALQKQSVLAIAICDCVTMASMRRDRAKVVDISTATLPAITDMSGPNSRLCMRSEFKVAHAYFTMGDVEESLELHEAILEKRCLLYGHHDAATLISMYCFAACWHNMKHFELAV